MDITHDNVCSSMLSCFYSHLLSTGRPISSLFVYFCYVWLKYYYDYYYCKPGFTLTAVLVGSLLTLAVTNSICNQFHFDSCSCG